MNKQLAYWWFPELKTDYSGIAWYGKNTVSEGVGVSWCAIDNPYPQKKISKIIIQSVAGKVIYAVLGITLSDEKHYVPVNPVSYGGPNDWAAATAMSAMIKGLAGVKNSPNSEAFHAPVMAPRWAAASVDTVSVTIRFAASKGYAAYQYHHDKRHHIIRITATTGGNKMLFHVLLPQNTNVQSVQDGKGKSLVFKQSTVGHSNYADWKSSGNDVKTFLIKYL
jgi:hypothetical protein